MRRMSFWVCCVAIILNAPLSFAQKAAVTDIPTNEETTISIRKGDTASRGDKLFEIVNGSAEIEGDPSVLIKEARGFWKQACADWKKELKDLNKDNKIISMDCGKMSCKSAGTEGHVCSSSASFKVKTKMN